MKNLFKAAIGGVNILVQTNEDVSFEPTSDRADEFHVSSSSSMPDITVSLRTGCLNLPSSAEKVFDCGEGWKMYAAGGRRFAVLYPEGFAEPAWTAAFDMDVTDVELCCGESMVLSSGAGSKVLRNPLNYPLSLIMSMYFLASRRGIVLHSAGFRIGGRAVVAAGVSGAGKSTLSRAIESQTINILSDDRLIIRREGERVMVYGTPWLGEACYAENNCVPLAYIAFLARGGSNTIEPVGSREALDGLLQSVSAPWFDDEVVGGILDWCGDLVDRIPMYRLSFVPGTDVASMLEKNIQED